MPRFLVSFCNNGRAVLAIISPEKIEHLIDIGLLFRSNDRISGTTGLVFYDDHIYVGIQSSTPTVLKLDASMKVSSSIEIHGAHDIHGLTVHENRLHVVSSGTNQIISVSLVNYNDQCITWQDGASLVDREHINDINLCESGLILSKFGSRLPNQQRIGSVVDVATATTLVDGLREPHSPVAYREDIYIVESPLGDVIQCRAGFSPKRVFGFVGYARGLAVGPYGIAVGSSGYRSGSRSVVGDQRKAAYLNIAEDIDPRRKSGVYFLTHDGELTCFVETTYCGLEIYQIIELPDHVKSGDNIMPTALRGEDGWLFLGDDSNYSVSQFTGVVQLSDHARAGWLRHRASLDSVADELGAKRVVVIAPSKESILPEFHPEQMAAIRPIDIYLQDIPDAVYPKDELSVKSDFPTYDKTDTHWNEYGAYKANQIVLERLGISEFDIDANRFRVKNEFVGDLGNKLIPPVSSASVVLFDRNLSDHRVFDNRIHNHGRLWIYENADARVQSTCVLFGDSYSVFSVKMLSEVFKRLVYIHSTALDLQIVRNERPEYIICQIAERFLVGAPPESGAFDIRDVIKAKIVAAPESERERLIEIQKARWPDFEITRQEATAT